MSSIFIPALVKARRLASTGPSPMISGLRALTPVAKMRASGVKPSSAARRSLMITTAAAPSFKGQQFPAVTVPSGAEDGLQSGDGLDCGAWPRAVVSTHHGAVRQRHGHDLGVEDLVRNCLLGKVLGTYAELVLLGAGDAAYGGDVLRGLTHRNVDIGQRSVLVRVMPRLIACCRGQAALLRGGEDRIMGVDRVDTGGTETAIARDALHPGRNEGMTLTGLDGVKGHPGGLHTGG